jgi:hypothetical protein
VTRGESHVAGLSFDNENRVILRPTENAEIVIASKRPQKMRKFIPGSQSINGFSAVFQGTMRRFWVGGAFTQALD